MGMTCVYRMTYIGQSHEHLDTPAPSRQHATPLAIPQNSVKVDLNLVATLLLTMAVGCDFLEETYSEDVSLRVQIGYNWHL